MRTVTSRKAFTGAAGRISRADSNCVMCQYIVQRVHGMVIQYTMGGAPVALIGTTAAGAGAAAPAAGAAAAAAPAAPAAPAADAASSFVETDAKFSPQNMPEPGRRFRSSDNLGYRPLNSRFSHPSQITPESIAARQQWKSMMSTIYDNVEQMCAMRMPIPFRYSCQFIQANFEKVRAGEMDWREIGVFFVFVFVLKGSILD